MRLALLLVPARRASAARTHGRGVHLRRGRIAQSALAIRPALDALLMALAGARRAQERAARVAAGVTERAPSSQASTNARAAR